MENFARALKKGVALVALSGVVGFGGVSGALAQDMSADEKAQAEASLEQLRQANLADPSNIRVAFARALTAKKLGYTSEAIRVLEQLTSSNQNLPRAELELAALYYSTGDFEKAKPLFESAAADDSASPELKATIGDYVEAIDRRLQTSITTGNVVVGIAWQSNANAASEEFASQVANANAAGLDEEDDFNAFVSGGISHISRIGDWKRTTWESTVKGYASVQFEQDQVNLGYAEAMTGVKFAMGQDRLDNVTLKPYLKVSYLFLEDASYNLNTSAGALANVRLGDAVVLGTGYEYTLQTYFDDARPNAEDREADEHQFTASLGFLMSKETTLTVKGDYYMVDADTQWWSNDAYQASVRLTHVSGGAPLPGILPMTFSAGASWYSADYDGPNAGLVLTADKTTTRDDERWAFDLSALLPLSDSIGISAAASYTMQDSNVTVYDYDNIRASLGVAFAF